jgi:CRISPR-associated protein Cmr4
MYNQKKILVIRNITPLHAGSGSEIGFVDLPIQREKHTNFPKIEASSLKGSIREALESKLGQDNIKIHLTFGYDEDSDVKEEIKKKLNGDGNDNNTEYAGSVAFSDARLLLFPVKSAKKVFAWITCPYVLNRFNTELILAGLEPIKLPEELKNINNNNDFCIAASKKQLIDQKMILEEYAFNADVNQELAQTMAKLVGVPDLTERLTVVSDDAFKNFVSTSTEVITRTKIDNSTGAVKDGALFNEEYLPAESVLYSIIMAAPVFNKINEGLDSGDKTLQFIVQNLPEYFQIGGNATLGKGIVKTNLLGA